MRQPSFTSQVQDDLPAARRQVIIIGGPNGSGKTTCAKHLLHDFLDIHTYVNADRIALEHFGYYPEENMVRPGKIMLRRLWDLAEKHEDFAFETTLAPKYFAHWLKGLTKQRYDFILHFVWLQSPELAVERVNARVKLGGHSVPEEVVRRRYWSGIKNFFNLYRHLAVSWRVYDNSSLNPPQCIAFGHPGSQATIIEPHLWEAFRRGRHE
jgi:predicted ABC-type ATPase